MLRDLTMIFSVLVSVASLGFGVYKNIEAGNAKGFAIEQSYRVMKTVQDANISTSAKATILDAALSELATPPPPIDLSRSSADAGTPSACPDEQTALCADLASRLGEANAACAKAKDAVCASATSLKQDIILNQCFGCF